MSFDDVLLDVLALPAWRLHPDRDLSRFAAKHIGIGCQMYWPEFVGYLSRGTPGDPARYPDPEIAKRQEGGWTGGRFRGGWRHHTAFVSTQLLTIDVDGHGEIERAAAALAPFRKAIHSTYKSTCDAPRCRVVLPLFAPCTDLRKYKFAHAAMRERLYGWGYLRPDRERQVKGDIDEGASDATRLSYAPMHHPDRAFAFVATAGELLELSRLPAKPTPPSRHSLAPRERNSDAYREGALRRAEAEVRTALPGQRHGEVFKAAAALSRAELGLRDGEIFAALLPAWLQAAGEGRRHEGEQTIADGIARGRGGL